LLAILDGDEEPSLKGVEGMWNEFIIDTEKSACYISKVTLFRENVKAES